MKNTDILELKTKEIRLMLKELELKEQEKELNQLYTTYNEKVAALNREYDKWLEEPKVGKQMEYSGALIVYMSLILANILLQITLYTDNVISIKAIFSIFNILCLMVMYFFSTKIIRIHNEYVIKKGDYKLNDRGNKNE